MTTVLVTRLTSAAKTANVTRAATAAANAVAMSMGSAATTVPAIKKKMMNGHMPKGHPDHSKELARLNRISGQLEGVKRMIEERRYCPEILIQLRAIRSAVRAVESNILKTHLQSCVVQSFASDADREQKIEELKKLFDQFEA